MKINIIMFLFFMLNGSFIIQESAGIFGHPPSSPCQPDDSKKTNINNTKKYQSKILHIKSIKDLENQAKNCTHKTLWISDVDGVLIKSLRTVPKNFTLSQALKERSPEHVDVSMPKILKNLQKKRAKIIALTHLNTGPWGSIPKTEEWRNRELRTLGYNFAQSWPGVPYDTLSNGSMFYKGILFSAKKHHMLDKGETLEYFLQHAKKYKIPLNFDKIVFVDDVPHNTHAVGKIAKKHRIPYVGIIYDGESLHLS